MPLDAQRHCDQYANAQAGGGNARDTEYRAFSMITARLIDAQKQSFDEPAPIVQALNDNRLLWSSLAGDCARNENALPMQVRASIISLQRKVNAYSRDVIQARKSLQPLIDINRIIMDGLAGRSAP